MKEESGREWIPIGMVLHGFLFFLLFFFFNLSFFFFFAGGEKISLTIALQMIEARDR